ncbi:MAG: hypothetical protein OXI23_17000, partial [Gemmatimonadota bacterium]|nr:hypothetical protein [Gemmatimonadota bacterium]
MARRASGLIVSGASVPWAGNSGANIIEYADVSGGALVIADGLPTEFDSDRYIQSSVFNRVIHDLWDFAVDVGQHGLLEWHASQRYALYARIVGSDGNVYYALQPSTGHDPTDTNNSAYWRREVVRASDVNVEAGSSTTELLTPSGLQSLFKASPNDRWKAKEGSFGLVRLATNSETDGGSEGDRVVTPASLRRHLLAPLASPALTGNPTATTQNTNDNSTRIATTAYVQGLVSTIDTDGIVGPRGPRGPQGDPGAAGARGATGPAGPQGERGPQGIQGETGPAGRGDPGPAGPQGERGPRGYTGAAGSDGSDGSDGARGPTGPTGPQGERGPRGYKGDKGDTGSQGPAGAAGGSVKRYDNSSISLSRSSWTTLTGVNNIPSG